jgi:hypothetical protein
MFLEKQARIERPVLQFGRFVFLGKRAVVTRYDKVAARLTSEWQSRIRLAEHLRGHTTDRD